MDYGRRTNSNNKQYKHGRGYFKVVLIIVLSLPFLIPFLHFCVVVSQPFEAEADNEYVIRGNAAIMKCEVPSFVADFVYVEMWMDSEGGTYYPGKSEGKRSKIKYSYILIESR